MAMLNYQRVSWDDVHIPKPTASTPSCFDPGRDCNNPMAEWWRKTHPQINFRVVLLNLPNIFQTVHVCPRFLSRAIEAPSSSVFRRNPRGNWPKPENYPYDPWWQISWMIYPDLLQGSHLTKKNTTTWKAELTTIHGSSPVILTFSLIPTTAANLTCFHVSIVQFAKRPILLLSGLKIHNYRDYTHEWQNHKTSRIYITCHLASQLHDKSQECPKMAILNILIRENNDKP